MEQSCSKDIGEPTPDPLIRKEVDVILMGTVKSRRILTYQEVLRNNSAHSNGTYIPPSYNQLFTTGGYEKVISEGHVWPKPKALTRAWPNIDVGGQFDVFRNIVNVNPAHTNGTTGGNVGYDFNGTLIPLFTPSLATSPNYPTPPFESSILAQGTIGWNRFKPTASKGGLGQALAELHQVPRIPFVHSMKDAARAMHKERISRFGHGSGRSVLSRTGDEYLNWVFGWMPLVNDIKDLVHNVRNLHKNITQLARDNGQPVRRKGTITSSSVDSVLVRSPSTALAFPSLATQLYQGNLTAVKHTTVNQKYWFSGRFRYWIGPKGAQWATDKVHIPSREDYQLERILFGVDPTDLHLYYELMPWSWLVDWVVPVGPIIDNFVNDSTDNLVADYAYVMAHLSTNEEEVVNGQLQNGPPFSCSYSRLSETKTRRYASPYGFGISLTGLSPARLAILGALGLTRIF